MYEETLKGDGQFKEQLNGTQNSLKSEMPVLPMKNTSYNYCYKNYFF